ncbi:MAG: TasA family protein [Clostridia bacterium]|nr:TasA family protein [Clostridia bacterium]
MKKQVIIGSVCAVAAAVAAGSTLAYFTAEDTAVNTISTGNLDITINEYKDTQCGEVSYTDPTTPVMPGDCISKKVRVENTGNGSAYIRAKIDMSFEGDDESLPTDFIKLNIGKNWTLSDDGYYYYKYVVKPGEETTNLFTTVTFDNEMGNDYQNQKLNIDINAEAIQSKNNDRNNPFVED